MKKSFINLLILVVLCLSISFSVYASSKYLQMGGIRWVVDMLLLCTGIILAAVRLDTLILGMAEPTILHRIVNLRTVLLMGENL